MPFVSKATGKPLAKIAARTMVGQTLVQQDALTEIIPPYYSVKEVVIPFAKFHGVDPLIGPEMRSTGEVMGVGESFVQAFAKANLGAGVPVPKKGKVLLSLRDNDKNRAVELGKAMLQKGFTLEATSGTANLLNNANVDCDVVNKLSEGRPNIVDAIKNGEYCYIINTTDGRQAIADSVYIRKEALLNKVAYTTTMNGAFATMNAHASDDRRDVNSVQELHERIIE